MGSTEPRVPIFPRFTLKEAGLALLAAGLFALTIVHQLDYYSAWRPKDGSYTQKVRLPQKELIKLFAFRYDNLAADYLYLRAIQQYGAGWKTENKETQPIYEYFDILTDMDPQFVDAYKLSNLVLSDDRGDHERALMLVRKGLKHTNNNWELAYLGMYSALWGMKNPERAVEFVQAAKKNPETPEHILRMEEFIQRQSGQFYAAFDVNLEYYLRYVDKGMEVEQDVSRARFEVIIDQWNRLELARGAERYFEKHGEHPESIEQLATPEFLPGYEAATLTTLNEAVIAHLEKGDRLSDSRDEIREESMTTIKGIPQEPAGTWYFLNGLFRKQFLESKESKARGETLEARFPYFDSISEAVKTLDNDALAGQDMIQEYIKQFGEAPTMDEVIGKKLLGHDGLGGHWVYMRAVEGEDGKVLPRYFSTTTMRINERREPRMGLHGYLENFVPRIEFVAPGDTPYLQAEPSVWDFREDIDWALVHGLVPGVPFYLQDQALQDKAAGSDGYIDVPYPMPVK